MDHSSAGPGADTGDEVTVAARSSFIDSLKGCGLSGIRIDKHELNTKVIMPQYLRFALRDSIRLKDPIAGASATTPPQNMVSPSPETPLVVFINPRSGGRHGQKLKQRLQELISEEQVFDLLDVKPHEFVQYGLRCLEILADHGDVCAKLTRQKIRIMVAGGDGTVGWVLGSLAELYKQDRNPVLPVGIIPLGTGNDLARSFGWGGSFPFVWKSAVKRSLLRATTGQVGSLDSWHVSLSMPAGEKVEPPHSLKLTEESDMNEAVHKLDGIEDSPTKLACFEGVFYNYFSIGMDAQVAYGFHHLRNKRPYLAQGPVTNKLIYSSYSCTQGWFFTSCSNNPNLSGLKNILRIHIKKINCAEWEKVPVPSSVRSIVALNLHNYASGRNPWGKLKPEYLEKRGFVEAHADDGLLEIFGLKQGWHTSFVMVDIISAKHIAQAAAIRIEIRGGKRKKAYLQMDGEPWKQPISKENSTFVEIKRVPFQSLMINGE
ncbi:diacylglycerol kinase 7 [Cucumis melo var. makuwa]|uniref:Diacylglycerol kinase n=2 Tax=Cucumis melo TaxID=3656 RepID=A0A1S3BXZ0_CUCME|nr:diacylglycerol kinase 7 [Cucumis melo]KAA0059727.1 diacylglycerol kinase 7 [Cucumis melo var. makuwa]